MTENLYIYSVHYRKHNGDATPENAKEFVRSVATPFRYGGSEIRKISFFLFFSLTSFCLVLVGIEDYCCILKGTETLHTNSLDKGSSSQRTPLDNTQHSQETDIHAICGFRTRNPSKRAAADLRLRPRGHWGREIRHRVHCLFRAL